MQKAIGARVKELRTARGWTQKQLADKCGLNRVHICQLERGDNQPTSYTLDKLSKGFGMDLSVLFGDDSMVTKDSDIGLLPPEWKVVRLIVRPQGYEHEEIESVHETAYWVGPKQMEDSVTAYRVTTSDLVPSVAPGEILIVCTFYKPSEGDVVMAQKGNYKGFGVYHETTGGWYVENKKHKCDSTECKVLGVVVQAILRRWRAGAPASVPPVEVTTKK